jgi:quercetin dioxygenase-like cupin family protein
MSSQTIPATPLDPVAVKAGEGEARWWFDALAVIKATAADTGGLLSIIEVTEPPNAEAPLHVHHREDEAFWILEGSVTLYVGDDVIEAGPGDYAFGPRDVPHRYTVGPDGCRMLFICTPAGFEDLVRAMSRPAEERTLPEPSDPEDVDFGMVARVAGEHGCELLG